MDLMRVCSAHKILGGHVWKETQMRICGGGFERWLPKGVPDMDHEDMDRLKKESKSRTGNENKQRKEWEKKYMSQEELLLAKELEKARAMEQYAEIAATQKVQEEREEAAR